MLFHNLAGGLLLSMAVCFESQSAIPKFLESRFWSTCRFAQHFDLRRRRAFHHTKPRQRSSVAASLTEPPLCSFARILNARTIKQRNALQAPIFIKVVKKALCAKHTRRCLKRCYQPNAFRQIGTNSGKAITDDKSSSRHSPEISSII